MNTEIFDKTLLLTRVDFDKNQNPRLKLGEAETGKIHNFTPQFGTDLTLKIDTSERFCIGWHDLNTGEDFLCPENSTVDKKYEQCSKCKKRTGFDPAFYNASQGEISAQQETRNAQPHLVYLAYFSDEVIKVGISFAGRGIARLLEQGARAALILGEFPTANIARNYEEKISRMPDFVENVKANMKLKLLEKPFNFDQASKNLLEARDKIESALNTNFDQNIPQDLSQFYAPNGQIPSGEIIPISDCAQNSPDEIIFSGRMLAQVGYIWLAENQGEIVAIPLRKFTGYKVEISPQIQPICLPERQASLFDF
ncbi:MAG: DUF2797 domain-containing protein [bacterium]|nr:DUF2797 domain-containing protein [bacterium]